MSKFDEQLEEELKKRKKKQAASSASSYGKQSLMQGSYSYLPSSRNTDVAPIFQSTVKDDDDIAPIKSKEDDGKLDFFQKSGLFDDGWDFGDGVKTVLGTIGDAGLNAVKGIANIGEGIGDLASYGIAGIADAMGKDDVADRWRRGAQINAIDNLLKPAEDYLDRSSILGRTSDAILQGVGQVGGIMATGALGGAAGLGAGGVTALTTGTMFLSGTGSGMGEAYEGGANDLQALKHGLNSGAADAVSELIFGGLGKGINALGFSKGLSSADDILAKLVGSKFKNQIAKNIVEFGIKSGAEGLEEVLAGIAQGYSKYNTYLKEQGMDLGDVLKDENLLEQFVVGAFTSGLAQGSGLHIANKTGTDFITGYTQNEQSVIDKEVANRIAEAEADGKKLTAKEKSAIEAQVEKDLEKGYISTDLIEEVVGGDTYTAYQNRISREDALQKEFDELNGKKLGDLTGVEATRKEDLRNMLDNIKKKDARTTLKKQLDSEVSAKIKGSRLAESYNERTRRGQAFEADLSKYDKKYHATIQKAIDSGFMNNTNRTHEFVDFVAKISAETGTAFDFTTNEKLKASGFAMDDGVVQNGFKTKEGITLNMSSNASRRFVVGHEITHVLEGTDLYGELQKAVFDYAKTKGEYDSRLESITALYKKYAPDADPMQELTADLVGEYIFSDQDFVNNLSVKNQNIFQKIYGEIKHLLKLATAGSEEARMLEKAKRAFEKAYREGGNSHADADANVKYSLRKEAPPQKTQKAYKLMRLQDGDLYPLFIGNNEKIKVDTWYNADSPNLSQLKDLAPGTHLVDMETGEAITWDEYAEKYVPKKNGKPARNKPNKADVHWANDNGYRFMHIEDKAGSKSEGTMQKQYGDTRAYYNWGVNGSSKSKTGEGSASLYALRPGWHFGELPTMHQIGYGGKTEDTFRLDNQVWVEVEMSADVDYNAEAEANWGGDIPTHIPTDGYYKFATNPTQKKTKAGDTANDATKGDWYVAGAFKVNRILSDTEADAIIEQYNKETGKNVPLDYRRQGGRKFNAETMSVEEDVKPLSGGSVTKYSLSTWTPETQEKVRDNLVNAGYDQNQVDKWIKDTNSVAAVIASDKARLDFEAADNQVMLKDNQEYIKTLDASTLCAKRLTYQGTFNAIQHRMPNTVLTSDMLIDLLNIMKSHKVQTPCGVCYVESRRRHLGKFAQQWLDGYDGEYKPRLDEVTTSDGLEALRQTHPQAYDDFVAAMSKKGSSNPKVVQLRTEYRNEIMSLTPAQIRKIEAIGGLRVQSFSDFETPHLLDMMQAVMDMSAKGLHSQAYTKVPNFAWVFGDTGIKINLSLIAEGDGFDSDGNLAFSSTEGMDINEAMKLRDAYSQNVGTIIVGANDKHILACMADDRIDFIIPFHRSGWGMNELKMMGMNSYTDYTYGQKEHDLNKPTKVINGVQQYAGLENLYPPDYWNYELSGKENAERYLNLCAKLGREPKFSQFLVNNGDGSYSLQPDGSTDGYWKTLIDFKMYDNDGNGAAQQKVVPNFNMTEAHRVLNEYEGGANSLPVSNKVVDEFVAKYGESAPVQYSLSDSSGRQLSNEQQEFFKDSVVRDENGNLKVMYHGTSKGGFTVFDTYKSKYGLFGTGFYFTDSENIGQSYTKKGKGKNPQVYEAYLNIKNPLDMDAPADPAEWAMAFDEVDFPESGTNEDFYRALEEYYEDQQIAKWEVEDIIRESIEYGMGYDGITHIGGGRVNPNGERHQVYIAFEPEQIKKVDNAKPTENPDIRYSLSEDSDGNQLTTEQKDFFKESKVRDQNGNLSVLYHGSRSEAFTEFDLYEGVWLTTDPRYAEVYAGQWHSWRDDIAPIEELRTDLNGLEPEIYSDPDYRMYKMYADIKNPVDVGEVDIWLSDDKVRQLARALGMRYTELKPIADQFMEEYAYMFTRSREFIELAKSKGFDGLKATEKGRETWCAIASPEQVKLTSNQNPTGAGDIRYSLTEGNEIAPDPLSELLYEEPEEDVAPAPQTVRENRTVAENATTDEAPVPEAEDAGVPKAVTRKELHASIIDNIKARFAARGFDFDTVLKKAKNLSTFATVDNIPQRVMEKALGYKEGGILSDITVNKVAQNETQGIKWLNSFTDRKNGLLAQISKQYNIKPGSKESAAAQMYAEGFYVGQNNEIIQYGDRELALDFPDPVKQAQIKGLARDKRIRKIYDDTLKAINESRTRNAYPEIPRLQNYFLHFRAMNDTFSKLGLPFNPNDIRAKDLPTDLNGVTADLKPGQPYFASAQHRTGKRTDFDLLGGLEQYLTSAKNQIYHIDDIQNLRALRNYIADTYGQANGLEDLDALSEEEQQQRIEQVYGAHLSTFAKFLNEEANVLAGKTALIDRGLEGIIGRRGMTFLDTVNRQVGANMVGYNVSSSLTNFLAPVQAFAKSNKAAFLKGMAQFASNKVQSIYGNGDGFAENSPVMIRRNGAERFHRTFWQKMSDPGYILMSAVDNVSTELIARAKYNEFVSKGMDSQKAHIETDKWVSRLMGDRSLGQQPQLYNSKMLGIITKFQLEVRNQLDSQFYDTIQEAKASNEDIQNGLLKNAKTAAKVTSTFVQLAIGQHLFGKAFESIAGYNPAFDIISAIIKAFGWDDDEESEDTVLDNLEQGFFELMEDMPYYSTFTGGRIPIQSALPVAEFIKGKDQYGNEKSRWETLGEAAPYYFLPAGYGQIKKTVAGLGMFSDDHPIAGSYTDSGKLRFPVEDTLVNRAQAAIFGQYASQNARDYFDNDRSALTEKQIQEFMDVGLSIQDYWKYRDGLKGLSKLEEKVNYINGLDLTTAQKNVLVNNLTDRKEAIDMTDYDQYSGLEEFDFANKYPEKYAFLEEIGVSYNAYKNADDDTKDAYDWAMKNPDKYPMSKAVAGDVVEYRRYASELYDIKADKDENGKSISGSIKEKVIDYINSLDIDYGAKLILFKSEYNSDDESNYEIIEYLNSRSDISFEEEVAILRELGFTVTDDGTIYWD